MRNLLDTDQQRGFLSMKTRESLESRSTRYCSAAWYHKELDKTHVVVKVYSKLDTLTSVDVSIP